MITIEPIIAAGKGDVGSPGDGWTLKTRDGSYAAHTEHTIVITDGIPLILTACLPLKVPSVARSRMGEWSHQSSQS